ncbi:MAG: AAA family ATPase [Chitinophagaceae bacterium]|nr:AAA family ATPase [Chitinophagaceae bacterium]
MQLVTAQRNRVKIKMALQGSSGSGKTYSALLVAFGLCGDWAKIAVIDTENHSAELYSFLGSYKVLTLSVPFTPEKYIEAINICEKAGIEVLIIDSISHEWEGSGGILDIHSRMTGNSYTNWNKLTPRHNGFVQGILQSPMHVIGTIRTKQDYVLAEKNGKQVPEKVGLKGITREGMDYEFTLVFDLDIRHNAQASKDRTSLFMDKPAAKLSVETGKAIHTWCNESTLLPTNEVIIQRIGACKSIGELLSLYNTYPTKQEELQEDFTKKRQELLLTTNQTKTIAQQQKPSTNGTTTIK